GGRGGGAAQATARGLAPRAIPFGTRAAEAERAAGVAARESREREARVSGLAARLDAEGRSGGLGAVRDHALPARAPQQRAGLAAEPARDGLEGLAAGAREALAAFEREAGGVRAPLRRGGVRGAGVLPGAGLAPLRGQVQNLAQAGPEVVDAGVEKDAQADEQQDADQGK